MFYVQVTHRGGLPFDVVYEPNEQTKQAIQNVEDGKNLVECKNATDLFEKLGI